MREQKLAGRVAFGRQERGLLEPSHQRACAGVVAGLCEMLRGPTPEPVHRLYYGSLLCLRDQEPIGAAQPLAPPGFIGYSVRERAALWASACDHSPLETRT